MSTLYLMRGSAPCRLVWWVSKLAGQNTKLVDINLMKGEHKQDWFIKLNPRHCVPTYTREDLVLTESRAIARYMVTLSDSDALRRKYPGIWQWCFVPSKQARINEMLDYDIGTLYKRIGAYIYPTLFAGEKPDPEKFAMVKKSLEFLSDQIQKNGGYLCGNQLTLGDLSVALSLTMLEFASKFAINDGFHHWLRSNKEKSE
jgi:glutathione S-transferase